MAANTPFKKLVCQNPKCRQWKIDRTGKAKGEHCGEPMSLSDNWYVRLEIRGRVTTKSVSPRKRDAEDFIANCKTAARQGVLLPGQEKDISWQDAEKNCTKWWADAVTRKEIKQSTADFYKWQMIPLKEFFEGQTLLTIAKGDVLDYQTARIEAGKSPDTINHEVKALKRVYAMHVHRVSSETAPKLCAKAADIGQVALLKKDGKKVRFLDVGEIKTLLENATTPAVRMAVLIGLNTGLRKANVLGLEWKWVRLSKRVINLPAEAMKSVRPHTVDIPAHMIEVLKNWRSDGRVTAFVFPDPKENAAMDNFRTEWDKTIAACGWDDVTFHTLRHTFASQFLMSGGDLSTLSEILDHSSIQITKDIYGHLSRDHKRKAIDSFSEAFLAGCSILSK